MGNISVTIRVPLLNCDRDFLIPEKMQIKDVIMLIVKILSAEYGVSESTENLQLLDMSDGKALSGSDCFGTLEISDGAKLILV